MPLTAWSEKGMQQFRHVFQEASLGIALEDLDGKLLQVNPALCSMLGFSEEELCGRSCCEFARPEDSQDESALFQKLRAGLIDRYSIEKCYLRKDGDRIWGRLNISLLKAAEGEVPLVFAFVEDITEHKRVVERLSGLSGRLITLQEQERTRIARELHDDISQRLALAIVGIEELTNDLPLEKKEILGCLDEIRKAISEVANDVQDLSHELHSSKLEVLGLVSAMSSFCKEFGKQIKGEVRFESLDVPPSVSPDISLCLFRVLQEALHNAAAHSGVKHFRVQLRGELGELHLAVSDLGAGFDSEAALKGSGIGLISMRERLHLVNGEISIESHPNHGTKVHARVPLDLDSKHMGAAG